MALPSSEGHPDRRYPEPVAKPVEHQAQTLTIMPRVEGELILHLDNGQQIPLGHYTFHSETKIELLVSPNLSIDWSKT